MPRLADVRVRLPLQEDLLQLVHREIRKVHLLLSADRDRAADGLLGDLRRPHPLSWVVLYDADRIEAAARSRTPGPLSGTAQRVPRSQRRRRPGAARAEGITDQWLEAARSPVYKMAMEWKIAFPLHPEYRTLPMVWYVPPLSPIQSAAEAGKISPRTACPTSAACASRSNISPTC